jgi:hypothetical protein
VNVVEVEEADEWSVGVRPKVRPHWPTHLWIGKSGGQLSQDAMINVPSLFL